MMNFSSAQIQKSYHNTSDAKYAPNLSARVVYRVKFKHAVEDYHGFNGYVWSKGSYYPSRKAPVPGDYVMVDRDRSMHVGVVVEVFDDISVEEKSQDDGKSSVTLMEDEEAVGLLHTLSQAENESKIFCQQAVALLEIDIEEIVDVEIHADVKKVIIRYTKPLGVGYINFADLIRYLRHNKFPGARVWLEERRRPLSAQTMQQQVPHQIQISQHDISANVNSYNLSSYCDSPSRGTSPAPSSHLERRYHETDKENRAQMSPNSVVVPVSVSDWYPSFAEEKLYPNRATSLMFPLDSKELPFAFGLREMNCVPTIHVRKMTDSVEEKEAERLRTQDFPVARYPYYKCRDASSNFSLFST